MENLPSYIGLVFILSSLAAVLVFGKASNKPLLIIIPLLLILLVQSGIARTGYYQITSTIPPRFLFLVLPSILLILIVCLTKTGKKFIESLDLGMLTLVHTVRIPVELVLYWLYLHKAVPELMTFSGRNFDILAGLSAPLVFYFAFIRKKMGRRALLAWNFICLGLLINIIVNAVLSAPSNFQQFAFDQPNIAVLYFPFCWLPGVVVPLVLASHIFAISKLWTGEKQVVALQPVSL